MPKIFFLFLLIFSFPAYADTQSDVLQKTSDIRALLDDIDAFDYSCGVTPPPSGTVYDCLAGTYLGGVNMYSDEASETTWLNKRSTYRTTMASEPDGSLLLIGDSMIEYGDFTALGSHLNLGIAGESARQLYNRLDENDVNGNPNYIHRAGGLVILTAVNDLSDPRNGSEANTAATMAYIFERMNSWLTGKVVIVKLVKVDSAIHSVPSENEIDLVNAEIDNAFGNNPAVTIIDLNPIVAPQGSLLPQYHNGDGQHLSQAGYDILIQAIQGAL
jgi:lysophospholipase L1-like esterase